MKKKNTITLAVIRNPLDPDLEYFEGRDIEVLLKEAFGGESLSKNVKLYHNSITLENLVKLETTDDVNNLLKKQGLFYAVVEPLGTAAWVSLGIGIAVSAISYFLMRKMMNNPKSANNPPSPNNLLSQRQNSIRAGGRVPDIYGEVISIPDVIAQSYSIFFNNDEYEFGMFCVGRGVFSANTDDVWEGNTRLKDITGACLEYYHPSITDFGMNPLGSDLFKEPAMRVGNKVVGIPRGFSRYVVNHFQEVKGQTIAPPDNTIDSAILSARHGYKIAATEFDFKGQFSVGMSLKIVRSNDDTKLESGLGLTDSSGGVLTYNLDGEYTITTVEEGYITLQPINSVIDDWEKLTANNDFTTGTLSLSYDDEDVYQGYFYLDEYPYDELWVTLYAPNGLFATWQSQNTYAPITVNIAAELEFIDANNNIISKHVYGLGLSGRGKAGWFDAIYDHNKYEYPSEYSESDDGRIESGQYSPVGLFGNRYETRKTAGKTYRIPLSTIAPQDTNNYRTRIRFKRLTPKLKMTKKVSMAPLMPKQKEEIQFNQDVQIKSLIGATAMTTDVRDLGDGYVYVNTPAATNPRQPLRDKKLYRDDVTVIYTSQKATNDVLQSRERKIRLKVIRLCRVAGYDQWLDSRKASVSICHMLYDKYIGNLSRGTDNLTLETGDYYFEKDVDKLQIANEINKVIANFGFRESAYFSYTFDDENISAEDMVQLACEAVFCSTRRINGKIGINFESPVVAPIAIFNSHNIIPDSFEKGETFGFQKDVDGVEVKYKDPKNDEERVLRYPSWEVKAANGTESLADDGGFNLQKVTLQGVRDKRQAYMHLMRRFNKLRYGNRQVEFVGADESNIVTINDRISVADQMGVDVIQGTVAALSGDVLTLDTPADLVPTTPYVIFVQTTAGTVEAINITAINPNQVKLERLPANPISTDANSVVKATYQIVKSSDNARNSYIVTHKDPTGYYQNKISAINYSELYYKNDKDVVNNRLTQGFLND